MDEVINAGRSVVTRNYYDGQYNGGVKEAGQNNQLRLRIIVRKIYPAEPVLPTYSPTSTKTVAGRQMDVYNNGEQFITSLRCYDGGYYVYVEKNGYSNLKADEIFTVLAAVCPQ